MKKSPESESFSFHSFIKSFRYQYVFILIYIFQKIINIGDDSIHICINPVLFT